MNEIRRIEERFKKMKWLESVGQKGLGEVRIEKVLTSRRMNNGIPINRFFKPIFIRHHFSVVRIKRDHTRTIGPAFDRANSKRKKAVGRVYKLGNATGKHIADELLNSSPSGKTIGGGWFRIAHA